MHSVIATPNYVVALSTIPLPTSTMSASPAPSENDPQKKALEQITFRFCREWYLPHLPSPPHPFPCLPPSLPPLPSPISSSPHPQLTPPKLTPPLLRGDLSSNMLYPKEDRLSNTLMFACRTCQFSEPASSSCVFRNILHNSVGETAGVTQDVGSDPTVRDPLLRFLYIVCGTGGGRGAVCGMSCGRGRGRQGGHRARTKIGVEAEGECGMHVCMR